MSWALELVIAASFLVGFIVGGIVLSLLLRRGRTLVVTILPEKVFISRAGHAYHLQERCHRGKDQEKMSMYKLCGHCSKESEQFKKK